MTEYTHILAAVDLTDTTDKIAHKAKSLAQRFNAKLSLVHAIEPLVMAYGGDIPLDFSEIQTQLQAQVTQKLQQLATKLNVPFECIYVQIGNKESEILEVAEKNKVDLIVAGSHTRHGLGLLLGSTVGGVVKRSCCDVLAVHV